MKKQLAKLALTATLALAITLTLNACEEKEKKQDSTTPEPAAATETQQPSQEAAAPPPTQEAATTTFTDPRNNKAYKTVKIGEQIWMAENLNFEAKSSKCYDDKPDNCKKYGRLYDWGSALSACPNGWHLPSADEWQTLVDFAGGYEVAGKALKAKSGWNENGNGIDEFGFSALPSGFGEPDGSFSNVGNISNWWSAVEVGSNDASGRGMYHSSEDASTVHSNKSDLFSVRCIKD